MWRCRGPYCVYADLAVELLTKSRRRAGDCGRVSRVAGGGTSNHHRRVARETRSSSRSGSESPASTTLRVGRLEAANGADVPW